MFEEDFDLWEEMSGFARSRREFLKQAVIAVAGLAALPLLATRASAKGHPTTVALALEVNGKILKYPVDPRTTLLDLLREQAGLTGSKKGCDHGQCGACTVLIDGERVLACLSLAAQVQGRKVTTIEGLARGPELHPLQRAFVKHDALQCGYCTPGQICSALAMTREAARGDGSFVNTKPARNQRLSKEDIRERMSGNLCRCGAYSNIVAAIQEVQP